MGRWFDATFPYLSEDSVIDLHCQVGLRGAARR